MTRISTNEPLTVHNLRNLRDYCLDARKSRLMPTRNDIDPLDIPHLLPNIVLTDVHYEPLRFQYRP